MRTSIKTLQSLVETINSITKSPATPYTRRKTGGVKANVGNFNLSQAYGGYCLHRMHNEGGGVTTPLMSCHVSARECEAALRAFISGLDFARVEKRERQIRRRIAQGSI